MSAAATNAAPRPAACALAPRARAELDAVRARASRRERCAALVGRSGPDARLLVEEVVSIENLDARPGRFRADPGAVVACARSAERRGRALLGFVHTHPDGAPRPSRADRAGAWDGHVLVVATRAGWRAFWPVAGGFAELARAEVHA